MCFEYQRIIFQRKNGSKFSRLLTVRAEGLTPPPLTVSLILKKHFRTPLIAMVQKSPTFYPYSELPKSNLQSWIGSTARGIFRLVHDKLLQ